MSESLIGKRAHFPPGKQRMFLTSLRSVLPIQQIAVLGECSERTVRDWQREKFHMPLQVARLLSKQSNVPIPNHEVVAAYAHATQAGVRGYQATLKKYGNIPQDESERGRAWQNWWETKGKHAPNHILEAKSFTKPERTVELAECIGILMGDGGISPYQVVVSLNHIDDLEYSNYVVRLMETLFGIRPKVYHREDKSVLNITISRTRLVDHLHTLGLPIGNKISQGLDMPLWIRENKKLTIACIRGLVDTDGCVFTHRYRSKGGWYSYKKLSFTSASEPLLSSVYESLRDLGMSPRFTRTRDVRLDSTTDMERYFRLVGTHNPKHLRRFRS